MLSRTLPGGRTVALGYDGAGLGARITPPGRPAHELDVHEAGRDHDLHGARRGRDDARLRRRRQADRASTGPAPATPTLSPTTAARGCSRWSRPGAARPSTTTTWATSRAQADHGAGPDGRQHLRRSAAAEGDVQRRRRAARSRAPTTTSCGSRRRPSGRHSAAYATTTPTGCRSRPASCRRRARRTGCVTGTTLDAITSAPGQRRVRRADRAVSFTGPAGFASGRESIERDAAARVTSETAGGVTTTYGRDDGGRLTRATRDGADVTYTYDANGNRLTRTEAGRPCGVYDEQDRLRTWGTTTYTTRTPGELSRKVVTAPETTTYDYDARGNLRKAVLPNGTEMTYTADGLDRRTAVRTQRHRDRALRLRRGDRAVGRGGGERHRAHALRLRLAHQRARVHGARRSALPLRARHRAAACARCVERRRPAWSSSGSTTTSSAA